MSSERLLRWPVVKQMTGKSRTTVWRDERDGLFPKRRRTGLNSVAWLESEIQEWICSRSVVELSQVTPKESLK